MALPRRSARLSGSEGRPSGRLKAALPWRLPDSSSSRMPPLIRVRSDAYARGASGSGRGLWLAHLRSFPLANRFTSTYKGVPMRLTVLRGCLGAVALIGALSLVAACSGQSGNALLSPTGVSGALRSSAGADFNTFPSDDPCAPTTAGEDFSTNPGEDPPPPPPCLPAPPILPRRRSAIRSRVLLLRPLLPKVGP